MLLLADVIFVKVKMNVVIALLDPVADTDPNDLALAYLLGTALLHPGKGRNAVADDPANPTKWRFRRSSHVDGVHAMKAGNRRRPRESSAPCAES